MAKRLIAQGTELILRQADPKIPDYEEAERLFSEAEEYVPDYLYGYNQYARAYFDRREYGRSLEKLNKAYNLDAADIDTLLNLGYFYSRIDDPFFRQIKPKLKEFYYDRVPPVEPIRTQLDVALIFTARY
jgi:tetratricopeptide (TPR) repeat protein